MTTGAEIAERFGVRIEPAPESATVDRRRPRAADDADFIYRRVTELRVGCSCVLQRGGSGGGSTWWTNPSCPLHGDAPVAPAGFCGSSKCIGACAFCRAALAGLRGARTMDEVNARPMRG